MEQTTVTKSALIEKLMNQLPDDAQLVVQPVTNSKKLRKFGSDVWPEQFDMADITDYHRFLTEDTSKIPEWACITCPHCGKSIQKGNVRKIGMCFNARNFEDIFLEFICDECKIMETVYFRKALAEKSLPELLNDPRGPDSVPMTEDEMYKAGYNNVMERLSQLEHEDQEETG